MFFIMGINQGRKKLDFDQLIVCGNCGRYGHLEVYLVYSCLSLFFIPIFKWGRSYYVRTSCCDKMVPIAAGLGRQIAQGQLLALLGRYHSGYFLDRKRQERCSSCGFETEEDFSSAPICGKEHEPVKNL